MPEVSLGYVVPMINGKVPSSSDGSLNLYRDEILLPVETDPGVHNNIYRGKNLGGSLTATQKASISSGKFKDMYIGDYWVIGNINWRIAAFDYYWIAGDTACLTHHVVIVPDSTIGATKQMYTSDTTASGYFGSAMHGSADGTYDKGNINEARGIIYSAFPNSIMTHRKLLTNAAGSTGASGGSWYTVDMTLMTESNLYGGQVFKNIVNGTSIPDNYTIDQKQYPLFAYRPDLITATDRSWYWLQDVVSSTNFAIVSNRGAASSHSASFSTGVRPAFSIKGV